MSAPQYFLGIESSCDETGVAIYEMNRGIIAEQLYSQIALHAQYGGVVPELASRDHIRKLLPLVKATLSAAHLRAEDLSGIAYTQGPGLLGPLLVGASFAKSFAMGLGIPVLGVHHMEGHLLAAFLEYPNLTFPFVGLLVSGGHTLLVDAKGPGQYEILGESVDDAVGEAFDKTAKLMGLGYPGGARLSALAETGDPSRYHFPRPMIDRPTLDFSFSGLKTHTLQTWQASDRSQKTLADIARAFEDAVIETLVHKCQKALTLTGHSRLVIAGGVSANKPLRAQLALSGSVHGFHVYYPHPALCTDNGSMIAYVGAQRLLSGQHDRSPAIEVFPRWPLHSLPPFCIHPSRPLQA